jgi:NAD(P) transhydrogenase subunit alpha
MQIGIPSEIHHGERRVAATPDTVRKLIKKGFTVSVQQGAGEEAKLNDREFAEAGATIVSDAVTLWAGADIVLKVRAPEQTKDGAHEADLIKQGAWLICLFQPASNSALIERLSARRVTVIALDQVPRISRAQKMDVLSSMANIAGYRAVIEAANHFGGFFGGQITAAGRTRPAQVMVIGAGVAGLAAIAAARSLGAEVSAFDVRLAAKEQVESLGAKFLELDFTDAESGETKGGYAKIMSKEFIDAEMALFMEQSKKVDIIITTALIPGRTAPVLITDEMVQVMKAGSVVVDLAAEMGGNCAVTVPDRAVEVHDVTVIGYTDLTSRLATHASQFYGTNLINLLNDMVTGEGQVGIDMEDEVVRKSLILNNGVLCWPPPPDPMKVVPPAPTNEVPPPPVEISIEEKEAIANGKKQKKSLASLLILAGLAVVLMKISGEPGMEGFVQHFTVFILACFVGWQVVWNVSASLHTPLMSVTNAISGIIVVGGILQAAVGGEHAMGAAALLGAAAIFFATINIVGGFLVTKRMLKMFRK